MAARDGDTLVGFVSADSSRRLRWAKAVVEGDRIVDILLQLSEHDFTGALELKLEDSTGSARTVTHQILFDGGFLVDVTSRPRIARFELATMLLMAKRADDTQISIAAAHADARAQPDDGQEPAGA